MSAKESDSRQKSYLSFERMCLSALYKIISLDIGQMHAIKILTKVYSISRIILKCTRRLYCFFILKRANILLYEGYNKHLLTETEGNSMFCGPSTVDVSLGFASGNIDSRGSLKHTAFPRSQSISILLYTKSQRNAKIKRTSYKILEIFY